MSLFKSSSRYNSLESRSSTQSHQSDPSSSIDLQKNQSSLKSLTGSSKNSSRAIVRTKSTEVSQGQVKQEQNFSAMVKKFMDNKSSGSKLKAANRTGLIVPADFIAEDLKKNARKGTNFTTLHKKLFSKDKKSEVKALTEVKPNTRTLSMVLRSERELLSQNKDQEMEIAELKLKVEEKNREVEKLKDLCLKQREEIKSLKSAILFPDVINSQLQGLLEKQGSELKQAKQLIPNLQRQVTSLTGQLQYLAEDLAEDNYFSSEQVKAEKNSSRGCFDGYISSPRTPTYDQEEAANSLEFSCGDQTTPGSPDDMFLKDLNPCLTPYYANTKSKDFDATGNDSPHHEKMFENSTPMCHKIDFGSAGWKLSKSSDYCQYSNSGSTSAQVARRSDESKYRGGKQMKNKRF
ncbi:hypothetical protein LguiA_015196 [Lonicera macranthoides]